MAENSAPFRLSRFPGSSVVEQPAVNRLVAGSNPARGATTTVLTNVTHQMKIMREETFGPIMPVMAFDTVEEAIALANDSHYGLSANVFAGSEDEALPVAQRLNAGVVSINEASLSSMVHEFESEPFGLSGMGRSRTGPAEAIRRFFRKKLLLTSRNDNPRGIHGQR